MGREGIKDENALSPLGKPVYDESGELVCTKPFPSMPTHFWNDKDGEKYRKAYFCMFSGVWAHGDYCVISSTTGGVVMLGRRYVSRVVPYTSPYMFVCVYVCMCEVMEHSTQMV